MTNSAEYILSSYSHILNCSCQQILDTGYESKEGNPIPSFDENVLIGLCDEVQVIFEKEDNVLELEGNFIIVGDIHGSLHDLLRILKYHEVNDSKILFIGDYVDRGNFSLECITILFALKVIQPNKFYFIRGNHEFDIMCSQYGFKDEILNYHNPKKIVNTKQEQVVFHNLLAFHFDDDKSSKDTKISNKSDNTSKPNTNENKENEFYHNHMFCYQYTEKLYQAFIKSFSFLPICAIINKTNFCIHGGLSPRLENINQIRKQIKRPITTFEESKLFSDVLWSDPSSNFQTLFGDNPRGRGYLFNCDSTYNFLNANLLARLIRGHQCVKHGSRTNFKQKCITVFSASSYSTELVNKSGILHLYEKDDQIEYTSFPPLDRLEKKDAIYYKVEPFQIEKNVRFCFSFRHPKLQTENNVNFGPYKTSRAIKAHQSVKFAKPLFRTFSKKVVPSITKPKISHSTSLSDICSKDNNASKEITRSFYSLDNLAEFADNM